MTSHKLRGRGVFFCLNSATEFLCCLGSFNSPTLYCILFTLLGSGGQKFESPTAMSLTEESYL